MKSKTQRIRDILSLAPVVPVLAFDDVDEAIERLTNPKKMPSYSTATVEEMEQRAVKVQRGLEQMTASIRSLSELPSVVERIRME